MYGIIPMLPWVPKITWAEIGMGSRSPSLLRQRDAVDLEERALREAGDLDAGAGRRGVAGEEAAVDLIDGGELAHVDDVDVALQDLVEGASRCLEDGLEVLERALSLSRGVVSDDLAGGGVHGDLPRAVDESGAFDALAVGADGCGYMNSQILIPIQVWIHTETLSLAPAAFQKENWFFIQKKEKYRDFFIIGEKQLWTPEVPRWQGWTKSGHLMEYKVLL